MNKAISAILLVLVLATTFICIRPDGRIIARSDTPGATGVCRWVEVALVKPQAVLDTTERTLKTLSISPLPAPQPLFSAIEYRDD